jgi:hypothetical protein
MLILFSIRLARFITVKFFFFWAERVRTFHWLKTGESETGAGWYARCNQT